MAIVLYVLSLTLFQPATLVAGSGEVEAAVLTLEHYLRCEESHREPCFSLLSKAALRRWAEQGVTTKKAYADVKRSVGVSYGDFTLQETVRQGDTIIIKSQIRRFCEVGSGEPKGGEQTTMSFYLVREGAQWKIDKMTEGSHEYLP